MPTDARVPTDAPPPEQVLQVTAQAVLSTNKTTSWVRAATPSDDVRMSNMCLLSGSERLFRVRKQSYAMGYFGTRDVERVVTSDNGIWSLHHLCRCQKKKAKQKTQTDHMAECAWLARSTISGNYCATAVAKEPCIATCGTPHPRVLLAHVQATGSTTKPDPHTRSREASPHTSPRASWLFGAFAVAGRPR